MKDNHHNIIRFANFQFDTVNSLGKGATGDVYRGYRLSDGATFAIKVVNMKRVNNDVLHYLHESQKKAMTVLKHHNIIRTQQIVQQKDWCYFVMEECRGGTLRDYIEKKGKIDCETAIQLFKQIVNGYIDVVDAHIIHRDIKPANIMLRNQHEPVIIDFGFCELIMSKRPIASYNVGSPSYMSPQAYIKSHYSQKSDVWALGATLYEMVTGKTLDDGYQSKHYFDQMLKRNYVSYNAHGLSDVVKKLLDASFKISPEERASCHKLKYIIDKSMINKIIPVRIIDNDYKTPYSAGYKSSFYIPIKKKTVEEGEYIHTPLRSKPILLEMPQNAMRRKVSISVHQPEDRQKISHLQNGDCVIERIDSCQIPSKKQAKISLNDVCSFESKKIHFQNHQPTNERRTFRTSYKINQPKIFNENDYSKHIRTECAQPFYHQNNKNYYQNGHGMQKIDEYYKQNHHPYIKRFVTQTNVYQRPQSTHGAIRNRKML